MDCGKVSDLQFHSDIRWMSLVHPVVLLFLYYVLAAETRIWLSVGVSAGSFFNNDLCSVHTTKLSVVCLLMLT